ncbi:hypothetical protein OSTOST_10884, partial [Ostertagia ostertagi]
MEPSDARRMVPCLDEPEYKANWTVTMIHPKGTTAVSNGIEDGKPSGATFDFAAQHVSDAIEKTCGTTDAAMDSQQ